MYTSGTSKASRLFSVTLLLVLYAFTLLPLTAHSESDKGKVNIIFSLNVAVIAYDPSYSMLGNFTQEFFNETMTSPECTIGLNASISYLYAPSWALDRLQEWMAEHYEDLGVPSWAKEYATKRNLVIKWLRLRDFYDFLWNLTNAVIQEEGIKADDIVVLIGDVDGVSRQYYEKPPEYINVEVLEGVKGWAGPRPMAFYDLTVIPRPWPVRTIPFYGSGLHVNTTTEPPIWSIDNVSSYVRGLVVDHLRYHYLSFICMGVKYVEKLNVNVVVVDYGNETVTQTVLEMINISLLESMLESMNPWTEYNVTLRVLDAAKNPELQSIISSAKTENRWIVLLFDVVDRGIRDNILSQGISLCDSDKMAVERIVEECSYLVYVLATPRPSFMRFPGSNFNFTGFSTLEYTVLSFPGYGYRILRGGLVRSIAHEIGHFMGLGHPFQLELKFPGSYAETRWLMDYIVSPMSYYDPAIAMYRVGDELYYDQAKIALVLSAAKLLASLAEGEPPAVIRVHGSPQGLLEDLKLIHTRTNTIQTHNQNEQSPILKETTVTQVVITYETTTMTITVGEKETITEIVPSIRTVIVTVTKEKEATKTVTKTATYTRTVSQVAKTVKIIEKPGTTSLVTVFVAGVAVGYLVAVVIRKGVV